MVHPPCAFDRSRLRLHRGTAAAELLGHRNPCRHSGRWSSRCHDWVRCFSNRDRVRSLVPRIGSARVSLPWAGAVD
eukprot:tig00000194_g14831.t1